MNEFLQSIPVEGVLLVVAVVLFMGFCALLYKGWEKYYEERTTGETEFDYDAFNQENFGI